MLKIEPCIVLRRENEREIELASGNKKEREIELASSNENVSEIG